MSNKILDSKWNISYTTTCKEKNFTGGVFCGKGKFCAGIGRNRRIILFV